MGVVEGNIVWRSVSALALNVNVTPFVVPNQQHAGRIVEDEPGLVLTLAEPATRALAALMGATR